MKKRVFKMLQNTNKKSLAEGVTKSQKWKDSETKEKWKVEKMKNHK